MDQIEVDIIQPQPLHRVLEPPLRSFITGIRDPQLGGHEQLLTGNAAAPDGTSNSFFIFVGTGRVDQAIAALNCLQNSFLTFLHVVDPEHTESDFRHLNAVIEHHCIFHNQIPPFSPEQKTSFPSMYTKPLKPFRKSMTPGTVQTRRRWY